jgi:hypothetical protein
MKLLHHSYSANGDKPSGYNEYANDVCAGRRGGESVAEVADLGLNRSTGRPIVWYNMWRTDRLE